MTEHPPHKENLLCGNRLFYLGIDGWRTDKHKIHVKRGLSDAAGAPGEATVAGGLRFWPIDLGWRMIGEVAERLKATVC